MSKIKGVSVGFAGLCAGVLRGDFCIGRCGSIASSRSLITWTAAVLFVVMNCRWLCSQEAAGWPTPEA